MRALYLGRFNPPHLGHLKAIEYILEHPYDIKEIIIVIGSGEKAFSLKNPFTGGERLEMLTHVIRKRYDINKFYVIAIPDANRNTIWPAHLSDLIPEYDIIFTNNPLVQQLFQNLTDKKVEEIPLRNRSEYSGKFIRNKMISSSTGWEKFVPKEIISLISKYNGIKRIQALNKNDE